MSPLLISFVGLALFAAGICALPYLYATWRRLYTRGDDLQIWRVLHRRGIAADQLPGNSLARALRRCTFCPDIERCEARVAGSGRSGRFLPECGALSARRSRQGHEALKYH